MRDHAVVFVEAARGGGGDGFCDEVAIGIVGIRQIGCVLGLCCVLIQSVALIGAGVGTKQIIDIERVVGVDLFKFLQLITRIAIFNILRSTG